MVQMYMLIQVTLVAFECTKFFRRSPLRTHLCCRAVGARFKFRMAAPSDSAVQVALRIRPFAQKELLEGCEQALSALDANTVLVGTDRPFAYDFAFGGTTAQAAVYDKAVKPLVMQCLTGYNATVFAYGQTGSGKTHTMLGNAPVDQLITANGPCVAVSEAAGVIPRVITDMFAEIARRSVDTEFAVRATFSELYNEEVRDLLDASPADGKPPIAIREDTAGNILVVGLKEMEIGSPAEALGLLHTGQQQRATGCTKMNAHSSRSHAVFTIIIEQTGKISASDDAGAEPALYKISKFHLVDLAGR